MVRLTAYILLCLMLKASTISSAPFVNACSPSNQTVETVEHSCCQSNAEDEGQSDNQCQCTCCATVISSFLIDGSNTAAGYGSHYFHYEFHYRGFASSDYLAKIWQPPRMS